MARAELYELQHLSPGCEAPEVEGTDLLGKPMTLSEYRGRVVLLVFWASWCGPCIGDIPHEKELVERFAGRPFVVLGINGDQSIDAALEVVQEHEVPWRSFQNGGAENEDTIVDSWQVGGWPTVYLIDHRGIIRYKDLRRDELDDPIEKLVLSAESEQ